MQRNEARLAVRARINIVSLISRYIHLEHRGGRWVAPCPFHQETKPSFYVNEERGTYFCFGCQAKGDVISFYAHINGIQYHEALKILAAEAGITLDGQADRAWVLKEQNARRQKAALFDVSVRVSGLFQNALKNAPPESPIAAYVKKRGLTPEIIERFGLGYALPSWQALTSALRNEHVSLERAHEAGILGQNKNGRYYDRFRGRLIFPIMTFPRQVIAFGGRIIEDRPDEPKYINSSETPIYRKGEHLYGLVQAVPGIRKKGFAILTEGYMDVVTLHQFGFDNAVGVLGTALTKEQVDRLTKEFTSRLLLLFDGDKPGQKAAERACQMILPKGVACDVAVLPEQDDIDSLLRSDDGTKKCTELLANAKDGLTFYSERLLKLAPREMIRELNVFLGKIAIPELFPPMRSRLCALLGLSEESIRQKPCPETEREEGRRAEIFHPKRLPESLSRSEEQLLMYAARYPGDIHLLYDRGIEVLLKSGTSKELWEKLQHPEDCPDILNEQEQRYWEQWCGRFAPPITEDHRQERLGSIRLIEQLLTLENKNLVEKALRRNAKNDDFESDLVYLQALQQTVAEQKKRLSLRETGETE
ncbi:MAG: DNA primase [Desulfovibrio sp.]|nr:DNA primase [Desulfovibrio sp.]